jgi:transposase
LYTFLRRTSPYPSFIAFDAPSREFCLPRRIDTNTPIQALVTLNDPVYLEAARELARNVAESSPSDARAQLALMYSMAMLRGADEEKLEDLVSLHRQAQQYFEADPEAICQLIGEENETLAVLTVMANTIMNLDEFLMKS